jgi:WD40 repeat protein
VDSKSQLGSPFSHAASAWTLTFSPDSTKLLVGSGDGSVQMWPVLKPQREALCAKMTHNMSREQWNSWISSAIPYIDVCPGLPESDDSG